MENAKYVVREADRKDIEQIVSLFRSTIYTVNNRDYSLCEVEDWAACGDSLQVWIDLIDNLHFIVAENNDKKIIGFASIRSDGYLHSMFVDKDHQRVGVATQLLNTIEHYAKSQQISQITSEVSITARPFFCHNCFTVVREQKRLAQNLYLTNFLMIKEIIL